MNKRKKILRKIDKILEELELTKGSADLDKTDNCYYYSSYYMIGRLTEDSTLQIDFNIDTPLPLVALLTKGLVKINELKDVDIYEDFCLTEDGEMIWGEDIDKYFEAQPPSQQPVIMENKGNPSIH